MFSCSGNLYIYLISVNCINEYTWGIMDIGGKKIIEMKLPQDLFLRQFHYLIKCDYTLSGTIYGAL